MQANRHMAQVEQEMARLYKKYAPGLLTYVRMRVPSPEDAEDLVVEVFVFSPGQTLRTYTFIWSGALPADHTYPAPGGIQVTSPNQLTSPLVAPTGTCS